MNPIPRVHATGGLVYTLSSLGGIALTPGNSGSTGIIATLTNGTASSVTLTCGLSNLPSGTTCSFDPPSVTPTSQGNETIVTVTVPTTASYGSFSVNVTAQTGNLPVAPAIIPLTVAAKIAVSPTATASTAYGPGSSIKVDVNVTYAPPFAGFIIGIFYNNSVLQNPQLDYSGGLLGSDALLSSECIDGTGPQCGPDIRFDGVGVVSLDLYTNSGGNATSSTGKLFSVTFTMVGKAGRSFSAIHFVHQEIQIPCTFAGQCPPNAPYLALQSVGYDGYFTNEQCGASFCKAPTLSVTAPSKPVAGRSANFQGNAASQNPGGFITENDWSWGSGQDIHYYTSPPAGGIRHQTNVTFVFPLGSIGEHDVTFTAKDNYTSRAYYTLSVQVIKIWVDLGIAALLIDNTIGVIPGTSVHIAAQATNNGVDPENSTLRLSINNQNLATHPVANLAPGMVSTLSYTWDTSRLTPRVYIVSIILDEVRNGSTILENDTAVIQGRLQDPNNSRIAIVQLISSIPNSFGLFLGLNLPETFGLAIVLVAVAGFVFGIIKKARAPPPEPL